MKLTICFSLIGLILFNACSQEHNYCQSYIDNDIEPQTEKVILRNSAELTFLNYWGFPKLEDYPYMEVDNKCFFVKDSSKLHKHESLSIKLSENIPISKYKENLFLTRQAEKASTPKEQSINIDSKEFELLIFESEFEMTIAAYGVVSNEYIIYTSMSLMRPYETHLDEIKNKKQALIEELINRMYCFLSTLEVKNIDPVYDVRNYD
jgi:hypothetical protein